MSYYYMQTNCFISMLLPLAASLALATSYVAAIRIFEPHAIALLDRNHPSVISYRMTRISALCLAILVFLPWILCLTIDKYLNYWSALRQFGLLAGFTNTFSTRTDLFNIAVALFKVLLLYCGPIANYFVTGQSAHFWQDMRDEFTTIWGFRDHVFAPITEELVYRAGVVSILQPFSSDLSLTLYSPLLFGLAHIHHGIQLYCIDERPFSQVLVSVSVQFAYTSVFGMLANRFYIGSGENIWCAIVVHWMCNLIGFPSFDMRQDHPRWFWVYCTMLVFGVVMFIRLL